MKSLASKPISNILVIDVQKAYDNVLLKILGDMVSEDAFLVELKELLLITGL